MLRATLSGLVIGRKFNEQACLAADRLFALSFPLFAFLYTFVKRLYPLLRKFFPRDKNYILERAQLSVEGPLTSYLVDFVKVEHLLCNNPLGIMDDTFLKIQQHSVTDFSQLQEFYISLAGVFRYLYYSDNQLEFPFDGQDEFLKYQQQWSETFKRWTRHFCKHDNFRKAVLELTVFYPDDYTPQMAGLRLSAFIIKFFDLKIDTQKGIIKKSVA